MTYQKQVVANKVRKVDKKNVIEAQSANEEEIIIIFINDNLFTQIIQPNKIIFKKLISYYSVYRNPNL